ncbi:hypothetical protein CcCBS67573_g00886 [Chytriomyces confervae]|uniref:Fungal lipase-type domain-containing protein n=1 Tax=Chytriomyces confervae TaxID=246404 RepID=A0A507FN50_9FUNG|nr:hypothetical protein HDU80_000008 [Chytriomyces hyalinus]TPX77861.1 hypothetical protein CcCBS67573_g00886 [Chytriomyces confervae]
MQRKFRHEKRKREAAGTRSKQPLAVSLPSGGAGSADASVAVRSSDPAVSFNILPYAQSAFCPFTQLETWNCTTCSRGSNGTTHVNTFGGSPFAASGYTAANPATDTIIVAFRGTNSLDTWISDLLIAKPDYDLPSAPPGTKVHYGFLSLWHPVRDQVIANVTLLLDLFPTAHVIFTGHSLGGALATIAAADIFQHMEYRLPPSRITLLTFAQPRVGNPTFAQWVNSFQFSRTQRVTNQDDWTPHLPPLFSGFKHFHDDLWIASKDGDTIVCADDGGDEENGISDAKGTKNPFVSEADRVEGGVTQKRGGWCSDEDEEPLCKDRRKWKYDVKKHAWVWDEPIGFHVCVALPTFTTLVHASAATTATPL